MAVALAFLALIGLMVFAFYAMWGMPSIFRGHHDDDGPIVGGPGGHAGSGDFTHHDGSGHSNGGGHGGGGSDDGGGGSH